MDSEQPVPVSEALAMVMGSPIINVLLLILSLAILLHGCSVIAKGMAERSKMRFEQEHTELTEQAILLGIPVKASDSLTDLRYKIDARRQVLLNREMGLPDEFVPRRTPGRHV